MEPQEVSRYCFHLNSVANRRVAGALHNRYSCTSLIPMLFLSKESLGTRLFIHLHSCFICQLKTIKFMIISSI